MRGLIPLAAGFALAVAMQFAIGPVAGPFAVNTGAGPFSPQGWFAVVVALVFAIWLVALSLTAWRRASAHATTA